MRTVFTRLFSLVATCSLICQTGIAQDTTEGLLKPRRSEPREVWQVQKISGKGAANILEDHQGFLWLGTGDGLARYDGYRFTTFRPVPGDSTSIGSRIIAALHEDAAGNIWAGGTSAEPAMVSRFDRRTERFIRYRPDENELNSSFRMVSALYSSPHDPGSIWIGSFQLEDPHIISLLDVESGAFTNESFETGDSGFRSYSIIEDASGAIWTGGLGLNRIESGEGSSPDQPAYTFTSFIPEADTDSRETASEINHITTLYPSPAHPGVLWAGGPHGLRRFDLATETFDAFFPFSDEQNAYFVAMVEDRQGTLWVGIEDGLFTLDRETGRFIRFEPLADEDNINTILEDRFGVLWVGTDTDLFKLARRVDPFNVIPVAPDASLEFGLSYVIYSDREDKLWIAKRDTLMRIDRDTGEITRYAFRTDVPSRQVYFLGIYEDRSGTLWMPLWDPRNYCAEKGFGGLVSLDRSTGRFIYYRHDPDDPSSISSSCPTGVLEDRHGNLWVTTFNAGLNLMDRQTGRFTRYQHDPTDPGSLVNNNLSSIYEDRTGTVWVGAIQGMSRFNPSPVAGSLGSREIPEIVFTNYEDERLVWVSMIEDRRGRFWVLANGPGLHLFDRETGRISETFTAEDGLGSVNLWSVREDDRGMLWLVTAGGLHRFDPESRTFLNYTVDNGLPFRFLNSSSQSSSGELFYGGEEGVFSFFPDQLEGDPLPPEVYLTGLGIGGAPAAIGPGEPLEASISMTEAVTLPHDQNELTFDYVGLHSIDQEQVRYRYRLEGYDTDWVDAGTQRSARYPRLPPGDYVFHVNAASNEGVWNETGASVRVAILPPWWRAWWAYAVYGLLFAVGVYCVDRFQRRRLIAKEREKTRERELAQAREIEKAYTQLKTTQAQLIQQEKLASLGQLTAGIAHEIKNPLNFVNNFSQLSMEVIEEAVAWIREKVGQDGEIMEMLKLNESKIHEHGRRADRIVESMMQHASGGKGERQAVDVNAFVEEYVNLALHSWHAAGRDTIYRVPTVPNRLPTIVRQYDETAGAVELVPQEIGQVLVNLFNNAFDAVTERGERSEEGGEAFMPKIEVSTKRQDGVVEIQVSDNGSGIPDEIRERIFEPFFTTKPTGTGTGLGLSLSYDIVTQGHGGKLEVKSQKGKGASFIVSLPVEKK